MTKNKYILWSIMLVALAGALATPGASEEIDLSGAWAFSLDPDDAGAGEAWYARELADEILLPGSVQAQGYGNPPGVDSPWVGNIREDEWKKEKYAPYRTAEDFKMPFWLQPDHYYSGPAWFQKEVEIPASWQAKHITLFLERPHWKTTVWVNGIEIGSQLFLSAPHVYDIGKAIQEGLNKISIRVENGMVLNVGPNSHSVSDHTQSNWNGIVGDIKLIAEPALWIEDAQVYGNAAAKTLRARVEIGNQTGAEGKCELAARIAGSGLPAQIIPFTYTEHGGTISIACPLGNAVQLWNEFTPNLHRLEIELLSEGQVLAKKSVQFGLREIETRGTQFVLNGRPIFLRGTLECCIFPMTGYPPTDVDDWKRIIQICKDHGLNHIRFHSWCPPEAAFQAADELGFYYQVECSTWSNQGTALGSGQPIDAWTYAEAKRILRAYGNHPSFLLFAQGNEPANAKNSTPFLAKWVTHFKAEDPRHFVTSASGWPSIPENDYHVTPGPRIQQWGQGLRSRINAGAPETVTDYRGYLSQYPTQPVIAHEIGQWCVYPNFEEIEEYTGVLKPRNFEIFSDFLTESGMRDQAEDFLMASGKLQVLCYKEEIESALRTPGFGGFELLDLHDFPGQGTALVGVLDPLWNPKPYVSAAEYSRFCGPVVPLARLSKRTFTQGEILEAALDVANYGPHDLKNAKILWALGTESGRAAGEGKFLCDSISTGAVTEVGKIKVSFEQVAPPAKLVLTVTIPAANAENSWDVWVYPAAIDDSIPDAIRVVRDPEAALAALENNQKVLFLPPPDTVRTNVALGFSSIFWNTAWTGQQAPQTLGILCDPQNAALAGFPTEFCTNWQWWEIVSRASTMEMDELPPDLRPIVQVVPDWFSPKRLGLVFEARINGGSLLVCSADLSSDLDDRPVARQLRHSLLQYMNSDAFSPAHEISPASLESLFKIPPAKKLGARITADCFQPQYEAINAFDGDPNTIWHSDYGSAQHPLPHALRVEFEKTRTLRGFTYLPRQDKANGRISEYAVHTGINPNKKGEMTLREKWPDDTALKTILFDKPVSADFFVLEALDSCNGQPHAAVAELEFLFAD